MFDTQDLHRITIGIYQIKQAARYLIQDIWRKISD